jgi:glutathione S-transferase
VIRSDLMPIREERSTSSLFYDQPVQPLSAAGKEHAERLVRVASALISPDRTTLFARWCIADADFALMLYRLVKHGHPIDPKVKRYVEVNWQRPSVREWVEKKRKEFVPY